MSARFHVPGIDPGAGMATLSAEESHHLARVLRLGPGDEVRVFDGRGGEWRAGVASADARRASVTLLAPVAPAPTIAMRFDID